MTKEMKKIVLSVIVALIAITANAQVYVGGTFGVGSDKVETEGTEVRNTTFKILPEVGYELSEDWSVGTVVGYEYNKSGDVKTKLNSTCKCNRILINNLFKFFVWREVSKSFTRSISEFIFNPLNLFVGYFTKVLTLWDILPDKPVGVFIGTTFP